MNKKKVLLTGVGGFVGHHTLEHILKTTDWDVVATDSFRHRGVTDRVTSISCWEAEKHRVKVITHDLTVPFSDVMIKEIGYVDYIISMASDSHVDRSITDPAPFVVNNVSLIVNMLELARKIQPETFIQVSTDEVYGPAPIGYAHVEWDTIIPSNPYSASKAAQEAVCVSYWRTFNVPVIITNTMNIIGERQDPEKFIPKIMYHLENNIPMTIHGTESNIGSRFYLHARNQADALLFIAKNKKAAMYPQADRPDRYHVVGEKEINNLDMAKMVAEFWGKPLDYVLEDFHTTRPGHDLRYALDGKKLAELGWSPPVPLEQSLKSTVEWTKKNPEWLWRN
jgi:dTDP-glucose 4,6-dehydratase